MKTFLLTLTLITSLSLTVKAQADESRNFVYYDADSVHYAENIRLRPDFFNNLQLRADSKSFPLKQVKFFNIDEGFFANTKDLNTLRKVGLAERIIKGKINIYHERSRSRTDYEYRDYINEEQYGVNVEMFYNKGYSDLKKVNYTNLRMDLADNALSMGLLEHYKKNINTSRALYIGAGVSVVAALIAFMAGNSGTQLSSDLHFSGHVNNMKSKGGNFKLSIPLMLVGVGAAIGGYAVDASALKKLESAVDNYNR